MKKNKKIEIYKTIPKDAFSDVIPGRKVKTSKHVKIIKPIITEIGSYEYFLKKFDEITGSVKKDSEALNKQITDLTDQLYLLNEINIIGKGHEMSQNKIKRIEAKYNLGIRILKNFIAKQKNKKPPNLKPPKPETLLEVWEKNSGGNKNEYDDIITLLKKENKLIDGGTFVSENEEGLHWNVSIEYLYALIFFCYKSGWIIKRFSGPLLKQILCKTFNIDKITHKGFGQLSDRPKKPAPINIPNKI